ncbi:alpha/beta-hydrolase [Colletotrichum zoysiae]|uniref:Carboxylic ester hydrolase n=1 Tax=Colletotrichum zoysiae TaxID=1216348 RepID=A0AAD9M639_9PEZI|nr:alpha/beta-hydrolase [Colletotrichum zoysiae]
MTVVTLLGLVDAAPLQAKTTVTLDLGYTIQEGLLETDHGSHPYFNFTDIRYAAPPTGLDRFKPPKVPAENRTTQSSGPYKIECPQAQPGWFDYIGSDVGNQTEMPPFTEDDVYPPRPGSSEDCLFLDVLVPEKVFNARMTATVPVLLFIHGGGYVQGSKTEYGSGVGLLSAAAQNGQDLIYVSINYRLGLFGFLPGSDTHDISPNLGLQDQVFALRWVQEYIHLFGGNSASVTVMGESAGAGSILYHLTSRKVSSLSLFTRAIFQSPYTYYIPEARQTDTFHNILRASNVSSLVELQALPTEVLQTANGMVVGNAQPYGTFGFGPVIDDDRYKGYPPLLLHEGQVDHSVQVMGGHNANEGNLFASPFIHDDSQFDSQVALLFPQASKSTLSAITQTLYPPNFDGSLAYVNQLGRITRLVADATITCNNYFLDKFFKPLGTGFSYQFSEPPAWHANDLTYTFMDPSSPDSGVNETLAIIMQRYFASFAASGSPNPVAGGFIPDFTAGEGLSVQNLNGTLVGPVLDVAVNTSTCDWFQQGLLL